MTLLAIIGLLYLIWAALGALGWAAMVFGSGAPIERQDFAMLPVCMFILGGLSILFAWDTIRQRWRFNEIWRSWTGNG